MTDPVPVLFSYYRSTAAYRVRIALNLKGVNYTIAPVNLLTGEHREAAFRELNPQGLVPIYRDGDLTLSQSMAIMEYIDEAFPDGLALLPQGVPERARVRAFCNVIAVDTHPLNNLRVLKYLEGELGIASGARMTWYRHWMAEGLAACEAMLHKAGPGAFCFGDVPSLADICLAGHMFNAERFDCPLGKFPRVVARHEVAMAHPAFQKAHPLRQPDCPG
ncbi:maleylacetoacetate isomerase/maleylpyruvate isomerase [Roseovarius litoreus]|uniref:Maleylacetoacetate isomerase/maleylpyruvate isomerase n=1 Tax=Roseovarius litoreus TaxID=1155722 RepID=A0A1M7JFY0_9RHOB|nr:maleylacetoacetate isomerase [Roseovarius litoreus]SHM51885.1 maleylacetoacetate isomerase/maleylpyruvate isomerase [Roseovarius litoreus]